MKLIPYLLALTLPFALPPASAEYHTQINAGSPLSGEVVDGSQGSQYIYGTLTDSTITGNGTYSYVYPSGLTEQITVTDKGTLYPVYGSLVDQTHVTQGGNIQLNSLATRTTIDNGGEVYINTGKNGVNDPMQGAVAIDTTIGNDGLMVNRYGMDINTVVEAGGELDTGWDNAWEDRNTAISRNAVIHNGGIQQVTDGGVSEGSQVDAGGTLTVTGTWHYDVVTDKLPSAWYRGTAMNSSVSGWMQNLGGIDENTVIQSGGQYTLDDDGIASKLTVTQGGNAQINNGQLTDFWLAGLMNVSSQAALDGAGSVGSSGELSLNEGANTDALDLTLAGTLSLHNGSAATHSYTLMNVTLDGGTVHFDPTSFATLNMSTLSGSGSFYMNTDIAAQQGDMINVSGEAGGNFGIRVNDTGASPQEAQSLQIIQTGGGSAQFTLTNPNQQVDIGTWEYQLTPDGQGNWSLTQKTTPTPVPTPSTDAVLAMANFTPTIFQAEASALQTRLDATRARPHSGEVWIQALSNRFDVSRTGNAAYRQTLGGLLLGYDASLPLSRGLLTWGISGGYSRSDLDMSNSSDGSVDSYSSALYASFYDRSRFWLDGLLKGNIFNQHINARMSSGGHADGSYTTPGIGGSLMAGYDARFAGTTLSPFIGFTGFISQSDDYRLSNDMRARPGTAKSALAQAGLRLSHAFATRQGEITPWVKISLEQEFVHNNPVRVNDDHFNNDIAGTRGRYQAGVSAELTQQTRLYASMTYANGDGMESPWTGNMGFSYRF